MQSLDLCDLVSEGAVGAFERARWARLRDRRGRSTATSSPPTAAIARNATGLITNEVLPKASRPQMLAATWVNRRQVAGEASVADHDRLQVPRWPQGAHRVGRRQVGVEERPLGPAHDLGRRTRRGVRGGQCEHDANEDQDEGDRDAGGARHRPAEHLDGVGSPDQRLGDDVINTSTPDSASPPTKDPAPTDPSRSRLWEGRNGVRRCQLRDSAAATFERPAPSPLTCIPSRVPASDGTPAFVDRRSGVAMQPMSAG